MITSKLKNWIITFFCIIISLVLGILTNDLLIGGIALASGLLNAYYAALGKRINYLYGFINYIILGIAAFTNHLYGIVLFYLFIFAPLQIDGFFRWNNHLDDNNCVKIRSFTLTNSIIISTICILGSLGTGYVLNLLPGQQLALADATSNCINLCGMILMLMRFKEAWWLWLINNIIDLIIWTQCFIQNGDHSLMMLITASSFLIINILGIINWQKKDDLNKSK